MISSVLLTAAILVGAFAGDGIPTDPSDADVYKSAAAAAGHDAAAHIRLALWCEAHGMAAERLEHLSLAVLYQPSNVLARGLLGLVGHQGQWDRPEVIREQLQNDPAHQSLVREYLERRVQTPHKPDAQMKLASWCDANRLKEQAVAHYNEVIQLDPAREAAWKRLGYKRQGNRWVKPEELAAAKQESARQKQSDKRWKPKLEKLRNDLRSKDAAKRTRAEQGLAEVTDPRAVPMIWAIFVPTSERHQIAAVQMLGQIDGPSASNGLAALAVFSPVPEVRSRATETLVRRDPRDVVGRLIRMIHKPFTYQVRPVHGPGSPGELFVEGERFNVQRFYENQTATLASSPGAGRLFTPDVPFDPFSIRNLVMAMPAYATNPFGMTLMGVNNLMMSASSSLPVSPHSAGQAAQAIAANPQNAPAILNQLENNPANRLAPPGFWFALTNPGDMVPNPRNMAAFVKQVQAHQGDPDSPLHRAIELGQIENNPANRDPGMAMGMMLQAQSQAAQRDIQIGQDLERVRQSNLNLQQQLAMDVQMIESINAEIKLYNDRALPVLKAITGLDLGVEQEKWKSWWKDQLGYAYRSNQPELKTTYRDYVSDATQGRSVALSPMPERAPTYIDSAVNEPVTVIPQRASFAAGTLVQTIEGPRPIEFIQVGDRVLCQGTSTGMLTFQPMVAAHRNQPAPTFRLKVGGGSIVATGIQSFWKTGKGWTMTRELKAGDRLRMLGGVVQIESIETDKAQPVYNVDIAQNSDFFVGTKGLLAHDFSFVKPVLEPFDRQPESAALPSAAR